MSRRGINNNQNLSRIGSAGGTRRTSTPIVTTRRAILVVSILGLAVTVSSFGSNWPFQLLAALGVESRINQANVVDVLQIPALVFFVFLTLYSIKATIDEYRRSFDQPRAPRPGNTNRGNTNRGTANRKRRKRPSQ